MPINLDPLPSVPPEIENAAQSGELVVFVGAGISRLAGCPSWNDFANDVLTRLVPKGIDFYVLSQIKKIADPRKRLSIAMIVARKKNIEIDYKSIFQAPLKPGNVYSFLNSFNSSFITTNYDKYLCPESRQAEPESNWRFFRRDQLLGAILDPNGNVIHLHGCMDDPASMVKTTKDYLDHYSSKEVQDFLVYLFKRKTILFLGYGLEEIEILEYIFRRGEARAEQGEKRSRRYILQGFYYAEKALFELLHDYYDECFSTELVGFPKDNKGYYQQVEILASWSKRLSFRSMTLADEAAALEEEIRG